MRKISLVRNTIAVLVATFWMGHAQAATTFTLDLTASASGFVEGQTDFSGLHFDQFSTGALSGFSTPILVSQGDSINSTVTFDGLVTIPISQVRTDLVMYFSGGSSFPSDGTEVSGTYNFFNNSSLVNTFTYLSTTSGGLASFAAVFPPDNGAFTFDSFTNNFDIVTLSAPGTLDYSSFTYSLVSNLSAVPEPATWAMLLLGFFGIGFVVRGARSKDAIAVA